MRSARPRLKHYIGQHETRTTDDFLELALGTPPELWLGVEGETDAERAARLDAARDILADDPELFDRVTALAAGLIDVTPIHRPARTTTRRTVARSGVAA